MESWKEFLERRSLNEAKVAPKNTDKTSDLIVSYFNNKLGRQYRLVDVLNAIKGSHKIKQALYRDASGAAIGVNFTTAGQFMSISVWNSLKLTSVGGWSQPDRDVTFKSEESFATALPAAIDALSRRADESAINEVLNTYTYKGVQYSGKRDVAKAMKADGVSDFQIMTSLKVPASKLRKLLGQEDESGENGAFEITVAEPQKFAEAPEVRDAVKKFEETEYADPAIVFDQMDTLVKSVGQGINPALLITGQGGIGKSFGVGRVLKEVLGLVKGEDYVIMKGSNSSFAMYRFLYNNYNKIIIFDDCDSVFSDKDSMNILKAVLDSGAERIVSWDTAGTVPVKSGLSHEEIEEILADYSGKHNNKIAVPSQFEFEGGIIFISNMKKSEIEKRDAALLTRCMNIDITFSIEDTINRIKTCLPFIKYYASKKVNGEAVDITDEQDKAEVMEYMLSTEFKSILERKSNVQVSFRTLINLCKLKASDPDNWKSCASLAI